MPALQKWSPFSELERFRSEFDELFNRLTSGFNWGGGMMAFTPPIESYLEGDKLHVRADLPGVDPEDVEVTVANDMLTIRGKREHHSEEHDRNCMHRELSYGSFERTLALPSGVKADDIKASYRNGVMELTVPLPAAERKVPIEMSDSGAKQIGGETSGSAHKGDPTNAG
jgi:HSP20 family protein